MSEIKNNNLIDYIQRKYYKYIPEKYGEIDINIIYYIICDYKEKYNIKKDNEYNLIIKLKQFYYNGLTNKNILYEVNNNNTINIKQILYNILDVNKLKNLLLI